MPNWKRKHGREKGEVKLPALPTASQFRARKTSVYQSVLQAFGREDDKVLLRIREDFADETKDFATIDRQSRSVSDQACPGRVGSTDHAEERRGALQRVPNGKRTRVVVHRCSVLSNRQTLRGSVQGERPPESHFERRQHRRAPNTLG